MNMAAAVILALPMLLPHARRVPAESESARLFAKQVQHVAEAVHEHSVVECDESLLARRTVEALYQRAGQTVPTALLRELEKYSGLGEGEQRNVLTRCYSRLEKLAVLRPVDACDDAIRSALLQFDPRARWEEDDPIICRLPLHSLAGIGVRLRIDPWTGVPQVITPLADGPAHRYGVRPGDRIRAIVLRPRPWADEEADPPEEVSTRGMTVEQVERKLQGQSGDTVRLIVERPGRAGEMVLDVARGPAKDETIVGFRRQKDERWDYWLDSANKVAYLRIKRFNRDTFDDAAATVRKLDRAGMKGLVLDLRFCPGGFLDAGVKVAALFLPPKAEVLTIRPGRGQREAKFTVDPKAKPTCVPIVCLINGESESMTEALAACLQDHRRAVVVGERSKGHGSVTNCFNCGERRLLSLTTALFLRPSGKKIDTLIVPARDADEWGARPNAGCEQILTAGERRALRTQLEGNELLLCGKESRPSSFEDRQLDLGLSVLRKLIRRS